MIKNGVLKIITAFAFVLMFLSMAAVDGAKNVFIPLGVTYACLGWLLLFCYANGYITLGGCKAWRKKKRSRQK